MKSFKEFTKKQKTIAAVTVAGLVLAGGIIGVATMTDGIDNTPATEQTEVKKQALELTLEFNETPDKEYKVKVDEKELVIQTSEVKPKIETNKIGTTKHEVKIGKETFLLTVKVQDSRKISLAEFDKLTVDTKTSKEDLETKIKEGLTKKDEKEKLTFAFDYSDDFKLDAAGEQEVKVTAHFENNKRKSLTQKVIVTIEEAKVEEETSKDIIAVAQELGIEAKSHMSSLEEKDIEKIKKKLSGEKVEAKNKKEEVKEQKEAKKES